MKQPYSYKALSQKNPLVDFASLQSSSQNSDVPKNEDIVTTISKGPTPDVPQKRSQKISLLHDLVLLFTAFLLKQTGNYSENGT